MIRRERRTFMRSTKSLERFLRESGYPREQVSESDGERIPTREKIHDRDTETRRDGGTEKRKNSDDGRGAGFQFALDFGCGTAILAVLEAMWGRSVVNEPTGLEASTTDSQTRIESQTGDHFLSPRSPSSLCLCVSVVNLTQRDFSYTIFPSPGA